MFPFSHTSLCAAPLSLPAASTQQRVAAWGWGGGLGHLRAVLSPSFCVLPSPLLSMLHQKLRAPPKEEVRSDQEESFSCLRKGDGAHSSPIVIYSSFLVFSDCPALCLGPPAASVGSWRHRERVAEAVRTLVLPALTGTSKASLGERAAAAGGGGATMTPDTGDSYSPFRFQLKLRCLRKSLNLQQRQSILFSPITITFAITFCLVSIPPFPEWILSQGRGPCLFGLPI